MLNNTAFVDGTKLTFTSTEPNLTATQNFEKVSTMVALRKGSHALEIRSSVVCPQFQRAGGGSSKAIRNFNARHRRRESLVLGHTDSLNVSCVQAKKSCAYVIVTVVGSSGATHRKLNAGIES